MNVIAERHLVLKRDRDSIDVTVKVGCPQKGESAGEWVCPYEIHFGDSCKSMAMHGVDSMQALQLTIATLDTELMYGAKRLEGTLYHLDEPFTSMLENSGLQVRRV